MAKLTNSPIESSIIELEQRKSFAFTVELVQLGGRPVPLAGSSLTFTLGSHPGPDVPPLVLLERAAVIDDPASGAGRILLQAAELDLDAGAYPFVITLRAFGYSLVVVKGEVQVLANVERAAASATYGGASPVSGLQVLLRERQVIRVSTMSGLPAGTSGGLDAAGVPANRVPTANGAGSWSWDAPRWSALTGVPDLATQPELDDETFDRQLEDAAIRAELSGAVALLAPKANPTFTGEITAPRIRLTALGDASPTSTTHALQIGPTDGLNLILDQNEVLARNNGVASSVAIEGGISALPAPAGPTWATPRSYVDGLIAGLAPGAWQPVPALTAGWAALSHAAYNAPRMRTIPGNRLELNGAIATSTARTGAASYLLFTLPVGLRPAANQMLSGFSGSVTGSGLTALTFVAWMVLVNMDGTVYLYLGHPSLTVSAGGYFFMHGSIPLD